MPSLRWQPIVSTLLCLCGLGVATYLTITHYDTHLALACPKTTTFNCETVTTSAQSHILGIPVAVLGLLYFVPMLLLCLPVAWRSADRRIHLARLVLACIGVGTIIYLIIAELFLIKAICLWCTSVHLITFILFVIVATSSPIVLSPGYGDGVVPAFGVGSDRGA
ncbi:MAG: vitamin K epoxide reductase family protein [Acidimicrobiales bacterium]